MNNTSCGRARHKMSLMRYGNPEGGGARASNHEMLNGPIMSATWDDLP